MNHRTEQINRISVIIVNWNGMPFLADCLRSIYSQTRLPDQVIVVDNASTDESLDYIQRQHPEVLLIRNQANMGFAAATNQGIKASAGDLIATVNNDVVLASNWIDIMQEAAETALEYDMFASTMLFSNRPDLIASAGIELRRDGVVIDRLVGVEYENLEKTKPHEVFGPSAGAAVYWRYLFDEVGFFDESYFAYLEDADLAWRARLAGMRCSYIPQAKCLHRYSASSGQDSPFKNRQLGKNRVRTIVKDMPTKSLIRHLPSILRYDCSAVIYGLITGRKEIAWGRLEALHEIPLLLKKRRGIQARRVITNEELEGMLQPARGILATRRDRKHLSSTLGV